MDGWIVAVVSRRTNKDMARKERCLAIFILHIMCVATSFVVYLSCIRGRGDEWIWLHGVVELVMVSCGS